MEYTVVELSFYDGKDGRPAYVAVGDLVYDVTEYLSWDGGMHFGVLAGIDATDDFDACHKRSLLDNMKIVGKLVK